MAEGFKFQIGSGFVKCFKAIGGHGDEQAAAGLGVAEEGALGVCQRADVMAVAVEISVGAAGGAVFGDVVVKDAREVAANWEETKKKERGEQASVLDGVAKAMPALGYSQSITFRASQAGFEWDDISGVMDKVREEIGEMEAASPKAEKEREFGDVLLSLVNVARWLDIDAESALRGANDRFYSRFTHIEDGAREQGRSVWDMSMGEKEALWEEAKRAEKH